MTLRIRDAQSDALAQSNVGNYLAKLLRPTAKTSLYDERSHCVRLVGFRSQNTQIDIDSKGNIARVLSPLGRETLYSYEGRRPVGLRLASGLSIQTHYDTAGRVVRSERSDGECQQLGYDGAGNLSSLGTADGATVYLQLGVQARVERVQERDGAQYRIDRDDSGRVVAAHDPLGRVTQIGYGASTAPTRVQYPDQSVFEYAYDGAEIAEAVGDADYGVYKTDGAGRLVGAEYSDGYAWSHEYDDEGRLKAATTPDATIVYEYDDQGRVISEDQSGRVVRYAYTDDGQLAEITLPDGRSVAYEYDLDGRVERVRDWLGTQQRFSYGLADHPLTRELPNGLVEVYQLDTAGRQVGVDVHQREHVVWSQRHTRDCVGRIVEATDSRTGPRQYQYDSVGRLWSVADAKGQPVEKFAYDAASQRAMSPEGYATFDPMCRPLASGNRSFAYDTLGNRTKTISDGQASKLSWSGGLLRSVELPGGKRVDYAYDAIGRRVRKVSGDLRISYLWAGNQLIQEIHESNSQTRVVDYLYLPGTFQPLAKCEGTLVYYYHCDQLGTPQHLTDSSARLVWSARYSAFGEATVDYDYVAQPLRFAGQYWDPETGLHYNRARYYDPKLGAYLSRDPLSPLGSNGYLYAQGNPVNGSDPLGLFWEDAPGWVKTTATIAAGVAVGVAVGALVIAAAPVLGVAAGVAGVAAIIAGGIAGGAAAGGLDAAMTEGGCVWCGIGKGALIGGLAAIPFAFLPASAGYLAFAGVGAVSGAIGYFADLGLNGGEFSWGGLGGSMLLGAGFGVAGKYISGLLGGKQSGARGRGGRAGETGGEPQAGGTSAKDAAKARAGSKGTSRKGDVMAGSAKNTAVDGEPSVATNKDAKAQDRSQMTKLMRDRVDAQDKVIQTNKRLLQEGKTPEQINRMSDAEMRAELAKDGVPSDVQGMNTTDQLRRTNNRVQMREDQNGRPMTEREWEGLHDENGNHGEVKAVDDELKKIEAAKGREAIPEDLNDIELHNTRVPKSGTPVTDEAMPRCDNCRGLTDGVKTTPELGEAEQAMDQQAQRRFPDDNRAPFGPSTPQGGNDGDGGGGGSGGAGNSGGGGEEGASGVDSLFD